MIYINILHTLYLINITTYNVYNIYLYRAPDTLAMVIVILPLASVDCRPVLVVTFLIRVYRVSAYLIGPYFSGLYFTKFSQCGNN